MDLDVKLLHSSFHTVAPDADQLAESFYNKLLERHPDVRPLFNHTNFPVQRKMLLESIGIIVRRLDDLDSLKEYLHKLGKHHEDLGVKSELYDPFGECLIEAIGETLDDKWTEELENEWRKAFKFVKDTMLEGSESPG